MRLIFVNRFYWPEIPATAQLLTDLAEALAQRGDEVVVITSHSGHASMSHREIRAGVQIRRVRSTRWTKAGLVGKAIDFITFYLGAMWCLSRCARRDAIVIAMTDPPLLGIGATLIARLHGAQLIHWVQDIYPELAITLTGNKWLAVLRPLRNQAWRRADRCVALGSDMVAALAGAGVPNEKLRIIPNWAPRGMAAAKPEAVEALRRSWNLAGKFVVSYSGNLGRVHDLGPILSVATAMRGEPAIAFIFVGDGAQRARLETDAASQGLKNVSFFPPQPRERLAESLAVADLHFITVLPGCEALVFPSKLYGIAAAGRPMLFIGPTECEVAKIVVRERLGSARTRDEVSGIVTDIRRLATDRAEWKRHALAAQDFAVKNNFSHTEYRWTGLLQELKPGRAPATPNPTLAAR